MKKMLKVFGTALLAVLAVVAALLLYLSRRPSVPDDYVEKVETGGEREARYLAMGPHAVARLERSALQDFKKYEIYYPADIGEGDRKFPAVLFSNGTGIPASRYPALFRHLASWGFIVVGTEERNSWNGFSSEMCLRLLIRLDAGGEEAGSDPDPLAGHVDLDHIGVHGHSQGGVGVFNAVTEIGTAPWSGRRTRPLPRIRSWRTRWNGTTTCRGSGRPCSW